MLIYFGVSLILNISVFQLNILNIVNIVNVVTDLLNLHNIFTQTLSKILLASHGILISPIFV